MKLLIATALAGGITSLAAAGTFSNVVTFDNGWEGWNGTQGSTGQTSLLPAGGNPGAHLNTVFNDFGISYWTDSNTNFIGDYTKYSSVTISIDVKVDSVYFWGSPVPRDFIVDFRSTSLAPGGMPWTSVWFNLGTLETGQDWTTLSVTFDPNSSVLPAGWGGYGDEDPDTYEPILPPNLTYADIMANVEELAFTTYVPGWFFGFTDFDVSVDNIRIDATPIPAPGALALLGLAALGRTRRRG